MIPMSPVSFSEPMMKYCSRQTITTQCDMCVRAPSCLTVCNPMDCSLPGSSVHGMFQARILVWVAISSSRGSSQPRDQTWVSYIGRYILYHWATWEVQCDMYSNTICSRRKEQENLIQSGVRKTFLKEVASSQNLRNEWQGISWVVLRIRCYVMVNK